jgi:hypothetical protein
VTGKARLSLSDIAAVADHRPPGYIEALMTAGTRDGDWLEISEHELASLRLRYGLPESPAATPTVEQSTRRIWMPGDAIARLLSMCGVAWVARRWFPGCGCAKRQARLNVWWSRLRTPRPRGSR